MPGKASLCFTLLHDTILSVTVSVPCRGVHTLTDFGMFLFAQLPSVNQSSRFVVQEGARVSGPKSAKLKRFAAALKLDDKHHTALVQSAAAHNMEVGNYG